MTPIHRPLLRAALAICLLAALAGGPRAARAANTYTLDAWVTAGGGGSASAGGAYTLWGTAGQAATAVLGAGAYELDGGFWNARGSAFAGLPPEPAGGVTRFALAPPAPNPSRGGVVIAFDVAAAARARLELFSVDGRRVATLYDRAVPPGRYQLGYAGADDAGRALPAGVYLLRFTAGAFQATRRVLLLR